MEIKDDHYTITLSGGPPWGFRLVGGKDFGTPLKIDQIAPHGKAEFAGIENGLYVVAINDKPTAPLTHVMCREAVKSTKQKLKLALTRKHPKSFDEEVTTPTNEKQSLSSALDRKFSGNRPTFIVGDRPSIIKKPVKPKSESIDNLPPPPPPLDANFCPDDDLPPPPPPPPSDSLLAADDDMPPPPPSSDTVTPKTTFPNTTTTGRKLNTSPAPNKPTPTTTVSSISNNSNRNTVGTKNARGSDSSKSMKARSSMDRTELDDERKEMKQLAKSLADASVSKVPICESCKEKISGPHIATAGSFWHSEHFLCVDCGCRLANMPYSIDEDGVHCSSCIQNKLPECAGCGQKVSSKHIQAVGKYWHPEHFVCTKCSCKLAGKFVLDSNQKPICSDCSLKEIGCVCAGCGEGIRVTDPYAEADDKTWHPGCFKCNGCHKKLGDMFFIVNDLYYCQTSCASI